MNKHDHDHDHGCEVCSGQSSTDQLLRAVAERALIGEPQVIVVPGRGNEPTIAYSVGLSLIGPGYPELIVIGNLTGQTAYCAVNCFIDRWTKRVDASESSVGDSIYKVYDDVLKPHKDIAMRMEVSRLSKEKQAATLQVHMRAVGAVLPPNIPVQVAQVYFPDPNGLLPHQEGYDHRNWNQPMLNGLEPIIVPTSSRTLH